MNHGQWTAIASRDGGTFRAYAALPPEGSGPGLVLLQHVWRQARWVWLSARRCTRRIMDGCIRLYPPLSR